MSIRAWLAMLLLVLPALAAHAVEPNERLADPALEARARAISRELRCLVCQNESIDESNADLAKDIRALVRERLVAGDSDAAAQRAIVDRYGDFVLLRTPVKPATWLLWFGPPLLLAAAAGGALLFVRYRTGSPSERAEPVELGADERERLHRILEADEE